MSQADTPAGAGDARAPAGPAESPPGSVLLVFAKAPMPGLVKTRLAAELGAEAAARLQAAFLADTLARFGAVGERRVLACAPAVNHPAFEAAAASGWGRVLQGEGELGERLTRAFAAQLAGGARTIVCLGSDSPTLPVALVSQAFAALVGADAVLAPGFDGGYVLVGARRVVRELFEGVPWGTERVFDVTARRLAAAGVSFEVLPFWYDVDDLWSLRSLAHHLGVSGPYGPIEAPATARVLAELGLIEGSGGA